MDKIRVEVGTVGNEGSCNWCDALKDTPRTEEVKLVYFDSFCLRFCHAHYRKMLVAWLRLIVSELFPE
ncbi:hypothetical protein LCGC14_1284650 [marine sediment metagenome]|uniref:Uncharacterized protein n=1 Tax=marine sediment metagenome TaxID=412755 RepID=A0A0F9KU80_9ZZZZ